MARHPKRRCSQHHHEAPTVGLCRGPGHRSTVPLLLLTSPLGLGGDSEADLFVFVGDLNSSSIDNGSVRVSPSGIFASLGRDSCTKDELVVDLISVVFGTIGNHRDVRLLQSIGSLFECIVFR